MEGQFELRWKFTINFNPEGMNVTQAEKKTTKSSCNLCLFQVPVKNNPMWNSVVRFQLQEIKGAFGLVLISGNINIKYKNIIYVQHW